MKYLKENGNWANQQTLKCNCPKASYEVLNQELLNAIKVLDKSALVIWLILSHNADGFEWKLSPSFFKEECNIGKEGYINGKKQLEEKGYIVWCDEKRTYGYFNRNGKPYIEQEKNIDSENEEEIIDYDSLVKSRKKKKTSSGKMVTFKQFVNSCWQSYYESGECRQNEERTKNKLVSVWLSA